MNFELRPSLDLLGLVAHSNLRIPMWNTVCYWHITVMHSSAATLFLISERYVAAIFGYVAVDSGNSDAWGN